ncbi:MAG TPA: response regulator transcription factor [Flavobacteriales bacterium]|mgnify:CR=1 FL=1|nr:response regulator transcription factor [Flavobacteriales bacterium]MCB9200574.1 response regulator transcription factor [Flavobacteriales bacterium]HOP44269.1 response regulator transcription factor [Flavobacteriales bacterium]HPQ59202.1 response regulator transcription factor [Flavobacteriales bacterium]
MSSTAPIPVALVDDHTLVRKGLVELIQQSGEYEVVLEASNGREFIEALPHPDLRLAIVDLNMPEMDGFETLAWLKENQPGLLALALTFEGTEERVIRAVRAGARGFILKDIEPLELRAALRSVLTSGYYHTDLVHHTMLNSSMRTEEEKTRAKLLARLTENEVRFLELICDDRELTYEQVAEEMGVHRRTVDGYREHICNKLKVRSKVGLVITAVRYGLVEL